MAFEQMIIQEQWFDTNGDPFNGAVLKAYEPGTVTNISIFIDNVGGSPQATITLNANGKYEVSGNEILPYIDRTHKWAIFSNAADAAADTNPFAGFYDNVPLTSSGAAINLGVVATMEADTTLAIGNIVETTGYILAGDGGNNQYDIVAAATGTDDGGIFIDLSGSGLQAKGLFPGGMHNVNQWGAGESVAAAANTTAMQAAIDWMVAAPERELDLLAQDYAYSKLTISTTTANISHHFNGHGARLTSNVTSGSAFQVGDGTKGWGKSVIEGFTIDAPTADNVLLIAGTSVERSMFRDLNLIGDTVTTSNVGMILHISGNTTFFNIFDNVTFDGADYCVSINHDFTTGTDNPAAGRSNATRFINCHFSRFGIEGVFLSGSTGNQFSNYDFSGGDTPNFDFHLAVGGGFVSKANYFQGRNESGTVNAFKVETGCVLNVFMPQIEVVIDYADNATEDDNIEILMGANADILSKSIKTGVLTARQSTLDFTMASGRIQISGDRFAPRTTETGLFSLGENNAEVAKWKQLVVSEFVYQSTDTAVTAFSGGGQGSATVLTAKTNRVNVAAAPGDSVQLTDKLNLTHTLEQIIFNSAANAIDIFPAPGHAIEPFALNVAVSLAGGATAVFQSYTDIRWLQLI